ncbi:MAG: HEAT repeat domain-containing protein [Planctomycetaceae bacterium]|nr:HEAT repeat domain-containing protein [Planctomycetaceae bacterium]
MTIRVARFGLVAALAAALGCDYGQPAPPPPPPPVTTAAPVTLPPTTSATPSTSAKAPPGTIAPSVPRTTPLPAGNLRDLAGRYLESDGIGGWRTSEKAATELEKLGPEAAGGLLPLLADQQVEVRRGAAFFLLGSFDPNEPAHVSGFTALLDDADRTIRGIGLSAVRQMHSPDQAAAVPRLAAMLDPAREDKAPNRESVARLLGGLKSDASAAIEKLASAAAADPAASVRSACLIALAQIATPDQGSSLVAKGLADQDPAVRLVAAVRLRQLGAASAPASKNLAAALADSDSRVRAAAAETLVKIGKPAVSDITGQLATDSLDARKLALYCLTKIGPDAKEAGPMVEKCLADSDADVKKLAAAALASMRGK